MSSLNKDERIAEVRLFMESKGVSYEQLSAAMGCTSTFVKRSLIFADSIPAKRHKQFIALGFPENILPPIFMGPFGRPPKRGEYIFPIIQGC